MEGTHLSILILLIGFILAVGYICLSIKKEGLKATTVKLIVKAEKMFASGEGKQKMKWVVDMLTQIIPMPFKLFITTELLTEFVQSVFDLVKEALDYREENETQDTENN
jgi:uncharacterized protein (DUF608 family)